MSLISLPAVLPARPEVCRFDADDSGAVAAGELLAVNAFGYAIQAAVPTDQGFVPEEGHYLLLPWECVSLWSEMRLDWEIHRLDLIQKLLGTDERLWPDIVVYRLRGKGIGQSIAHIHDHLRVGQVGGTTLVLGG